MSNETIVPMATADFLLGRMIATAMLNEQLKKEIHKLNEKLNEKSTWITTLEFKLNKLQSDNENLKKPVVKKRGLKQEGV
jgi:cell division protein FtsL